MNSTTSQSSNTTLREYADKGTGAAGKQKVKKASKKVAFKESTGVKSDIRASASVGGSTLIEGGGATRGNGLSVRDGLYAEDRTVYETAGIVDRIDKLKMKVEAELTKEANKSRWFSDCQRTIEEKKKVQKLKQERYEFWALADKQQPNQQPYTGSGEDSPNRPMSVPAPHYDDNEDDILVRMNSRTDYD